MGQGFFKMPALAMGRNRERDKHPQRHRRPRDSLVASRSSFEIRLLLI